MMEFCNVSPPTFHLPVGKTRILSIKPRDVDKSIDSTVGMKILLMLPTLSGIHCIYVTVQSEEPSKLRKFLTLDGSSLWTVTYTLIVQISNINTYLRNLLTPSSKILLDPSLHLKQFTVAYA